MVDIVKPLKIESGSETDYLPTETDPNEDYLSALGVAFGGSQDFRHELLGRVIATKFPDYTIAPTYLPNGELNYVEYFNSATQIVANRIARCDISYNVSLDPTQEQWNIYNTDGTTVLRTITSVYTYTGNDISNITVSQT